MKSMKSTVERTNEEEVLKILSEQAPVGACVIQDGKFCYLNSNFPVAIGYTADELVGKDPLELIVPEDREMVRENEIKMLKGELIPPYQFRVIHKDGSIRWVMEVVKSVQYHGRRAVLGNYMEITGRKQMEEALKESEEKYRELANSITNVFFAMDEHLRYTYWNRASEILTGIRAVDAIGKSLWEIFPDTPWRRKAEKVYRKVLKTQQSQTFVNDYDTDGRHYIFEINAYPSRGGISVFVEDIAERKQAEETLKQSEERYRTILEEMGDSYFETDLAGNLTFVNDALINFLGYSREELIGMNYRAFTPEEDVKPLFEAYNRMYKTGEPLKDLSRRVMRKDGIYGFARGSAFPVRNDKGEIIGFRGVRHDITERKQAEEALQAEKNKLQSLIDAMEDGITIQDRDYNIIYQNEPSRISSGGDHLGEKCYRVYEGKEKVCKDCPVEKAFKDGKPHTSERQRVLPSGEISFWENTANPIRDAEGRVVTCLEIGRNITERKRQEQALADELTRRRLLVDQSLDGIVVLDVDAKVYEANHRFAEMLGYTPEEARELHTWDWDKNFPPEQILEMGRNVDEKGLHLETKHTRKDGSVIDVDISINGTMCGGQKLIFCVCRDITERKWAEEALRQSEERYRTILEDMEDAYFEVDLGGHFTFVNNSVCRDLGCSKEELIGMSYKAFTVEEDIESVFRVFNEVYRTGVPNKGFPWKTIRKDGVCGFAETSVSPLRNDKGEIIGFRGVGRDVTERKQIEDKLRQSEENYKTLFNSSVIGMYVLDVETMKVVMGNRAAAEMAGFNSVGNGIGINPLDFVIPEDREQVLGVAAKEFEQDLRRTHEVRVVGKDGGTGWISITSAKIMHKGSLAALVSFTDITERKQAEEALRQSEENYRVLFDSMVIGTIVLDAKTMKIVMVNQAAAKMFGFSSAEEARGADPFDFVRPEDKEKISKIAAENLFGQDSRQTYELGVVTRDGREIWINATGASIMHEGKLAGLISFTDITEQKRQSERLMMTDRLASLGELAAGTAHELNNPLTSIIGFSQLLMEKETPDDIREDLKLINNEAQRAAKVTRDLLTFARKHAPVKQHNQINNIIEDVLELRAYLQKMNGIKVERQLDPDLPEIMVDYFQMQQVLLNIIINAEYFMTQAHNKGTLTITTKKQNSSVVISIADDGPGILPENLRRIFDPFFTTKEAGSGTGLGLSICHGIVTEHGGQIYVRSQLGKGATVFVDLPIKSRAHIKSML